MRAAFIEPMLLLRSETLPDNNGLIRELKLEGFRSLAFKTGGRVTSARATMRTGRAISRDRESVDKAARRNRDRRRGSGARRQGPSEVQHAAELRLIKSAAA